MKSSDPDNKKIKRVELNIKGRILVEKAELSDNGDVQKWSNSHEVPEEVDALCIPLIPPQPIRGAATKLTNLELVPQGFTTVHA